MFFNRCEHYDAAAAPILGRLARLAARLALAALATTAPGLAPAAPDEIVVFDDEFERAGDVGYEMHFNYTPRGRKTADYEGEQIPNRVFRFMPEVVFGLSERWNLGLHLPMSHAPDTRQTRVDGFKARLHYLDVRPDEGASWFRGVNFEVSTYSRRISESRLTFEARGIAGVRSGDWLLAVNPILNRPLNYVPGRDNRFNLDVFAKAVRSFGRHVAVGVEHFMELGSVSNLQFGPSSGQTTFLTVDLEVPGGLSLHAGIGHGWTAPVDRRVVKLMVGLPW